MQQRLRIPSVVSLFRIRCFDFSCCIRYNYSMALKEYFTEESFDIPGVDIPCCIGDYMYIRDNDPSSLAWDEDTVEGFHYCACRKVRFVKEGEPLCDLDIVDEFAEKISTRSIDRCDAAQEADRRLDEMLQMRRENDLRLGEVLTLFKKKKGEDNLGHRSIDTFAVEHLDFSGRLASELIHNHEIFSALQLTKEAFRQGEIAKSALRHLSRVLTAENEAEWLSKAQNLSLRTLERVVDEALKEKELAAQASEKDNNSIGSSCSDDALTPCAPAIPSEESAGTDSFFSGKRGRSPSNGVMMYFNVSNRLAPAWDFALEHFRNKEHYNGPISGFVEALLADYISSGKGSGFGAPAPLESGILPAFYRCNLREDDMDEELRSDCPSLPDEVDHHGPEDEAHLHGPEDEAHLHGSEEDDDDEDLAGRRIIFPPSFHENPDTLEELAAKLIELGRNRQELDVGIGKILRAIDDWNLHRILNFRHIIEYGKKRCELPKPMLYRLINLVNGFRRHPLMEKAFRKKLISMEQAQQILKVVTAENEMIWIDYAAHVSVLKLKEEVERCARIIKYDCFASAFYNILPGFRYITDDRYHELSEEMKDILRTGSWYQRSSSELSWPIEENSDEQLLMEHDPCIDEPWKHFKDIVSWRHIRLSSQGRLRSLWLPGKIPCVRAMQARAVQRSCVRAAQVRAAQTAWVHFRQTQGRRQKPPCVRPSKLPRLPRNPARISCVRLSNLLRILRNLAQLPLARESPAKMATAQMEPDLTAPALMAAVPTVTMPTTTAPTTAVPTAPTASRTMKRHWQKPGKSAQCLTMQTLQRRF